MGAFQPNARAQDFGSTSSTDGLGLRTGTTADAFRSSSSALPSLDSGAPDQGLRQGFGLNATDGSDAASQDESNYGKPRKVVKLYGPQPTITANPLPPLQVYPTAPGLRLGLRRGAAADVAETGAPPPTVAVVPRPEPLRRPRPDEHPFAPLGIDVGSIRLTPYVESDVGYDTNPQQSSVGGKGSAFARVEGGGSFDSQWSNHEVSGDLRAGYSDYFSDHQASRPDASGKIDGRIDVTRDTKINLEGRLDITAQSPSSPELASGVIGQSVEGRPLVYAFGGTAGLSQIFGRWTASLNATIDRNAFEDATFTDGTPYLLSREDYTSYGLRGRLSYEITPGFVPFAEAFGDFRQHDQDIDLSGYERNSTGTGGTLGTSFEISRKLTGEVAAGYEDRAYKDPRLKDLRGPLVDAAIIWDTTPLTTMTLRASTSFDETDIAGASGAESHRVSFEVAHALFRNLTITSLLSYQNTSYTGIALDQNTYDAGVKVEYSLSRSIVIRGSFTHERLTSSVPGLDYTQNVFLLGLRLQR